MRILTMMTAFFLLSWGTSAKTYDIDKKKSHVGFEIVKYKIGKVVQGRFDVFSGSLDLVSGKMKNVKADISVISINTENEKRDAHLRSPDFFDGQNPIKKTMKFRQTKEASIQEKFDLEGELTLNGVTRPVTLSINKVFKTHFKARTRIDKTDFGMTWNRPLEKSLWKRIKGIVGKRAIGDDVDVVLDIVLTE